MNLDKAQENQNVSPAPHEEGLGEPLDVLLARAEEVAKGMRVVVDEIRNPNKQINMPHTLNDLMVEEPVTDNQTKQFEAAKRQTDQLWKEVNMWKKQHESRIAKILATEPVVVASPIGTDLPIIYIQFVVVRSPDTGNDDKELCLGIAEFNTKISNDPCFANVNMTMSAL
jgi:hypothetical protein